MTQEQYPATVRGWLKYISQEGVSNRPFPTEPSDLINPATYADPLAIKTERATLAAILSIRAYQIAKPLFLSAKPTLERPFIASIIEQNPNPVDQSKALFEKNKALGTAFEDSFLEGLLLDEAFLNRNLANPKAIGVYHRLKTILDPQYDHLRQSQGVTLSMETPSSGVLDIYAGTKALPGNVGASIANLYLLHWERDGSLPEIPEILRKAGNSYHSFIEPQAAFHKADAEMFTESADLSRALRQVSRTYELHPDKIVINPQALTLIRKYREEVKALRSKTTRCSFLVSASDVAEFLDDPADFEEPLEDAFNVYMSMLAA